VPVSHVDQVLERALVAPLESIDWTEADDLASQPGPALPGEGATAH
jgi:ATP-dependent Lon protease